ncbi:MAG: GGDEF domain-containing protein, partial [Enterobacter hormaechei]|nr:GGDEF domain-containing protein [Enterobacter hormaechei]
DITERKKAEQQLTVKATTDDLTGCLNRSTILQQLKMALAASSPQDVSSHFCLLMFDLDYFKQINDRWGHQVGDAALIHFCDRIREVSPAGSALGRVGGEEFVLLLARTDGMAATLLSSRLRAALISKPLRVGDKTLVLSFSAGVVEVCQGQRDTSAILMRADKALYDDKRTGRGKTVLASDCRLFQPANFPHLSRVIIFLIRNEMNTFSLAYGKILSASRILGFLIPKVSC